jgi:glycosyltransferase involved in cell wall biosynthesis
VIALGSAARAHAEAHFGLEAIIGQTLALYRSLLA